MKLKTRTSLVPVMTISLLSFGLYLLINRVTIVSFDKLETEILHKQIERVQNTFSNSIDEHAIKIVDWAQWDRTYEFMNAKDEPYIEETLNSLTMGALGFSSVLYFNPSRVLYHGVTTQGDSTVDPDPRLVEYASSELSSHPDQTFKGLIQIGDELLLIASSPILPNKGDQPSRGALVVTSKVSEEMLNNVKVLTNLDVSFWEKNTEKLQPEIVEAMRALEKGETSIVQSKSANLNFAFGTINDLSRKPLLFFQVKDNRSIVATGTKIRNIALLVLAGSGFLAVLLLLVVINYSATRRLEEFSAQVKRIALFSDSTGRVQDTTLNNHSLRFKTAVGMLAVFVGVTIISTALFQKYFIYGFVEIEENLMIDNLQRAKRTLEARLDKIKGKTIDWAQWDDTYQFIDDRNQEYREANLGIDTLGPMGMKYVLYFDTGRKLVDGIEVNSKTEEVSPVDIVTSKYIESIESFSQAKKPTAGFISLPSGPVLAAASPILDSSREKPMKGSMIFAAPADVSLAAELAQQTKLDLHFENIASKDSKLPEPIEAVNDNEIKGFATVFDALNAPALNIVVTSDRPVYLQGLIAGKMLPLYFILGGILCAFVTVLSIDRILLSRIRQMGRETQSIKLSGEASQRVTAGGTDELSTLADDINQMLSALQQTQIELAKARQVAETANAAKSMFIARVSHELRTPIGGIVGINRIIKKQEDLSRGVRHLVEMSDQTANSLLTVIDEILDFSKAESGELTFEKIPFSVRDLIRETMQTISGRLEGKYASSDKDRIGLILDINPNVPSILEGDPTKLKQILINLLGNSVKFTQKGYVTLSIRAEQSHGSDAMVSFEISDTGIGIPAEQLENIFTPYKQADETVHRKYQGTGLGLSIVKQFTEGLGGSVLVRSTVGTGTAFRVTIPFSVISTDDYLLASERSKLNWPSHILILAEETKATLTLIKSLTAFGLNPQLITPSSIHSERERIYQSDLLVIFEEIFLDSLNNEVIEKRIQISHGSTIAVMSPAMVSIREDWYAKGLIHVVNTPVLADDLLLLYMGGSLKQGNATSDEISKLNFSRKLRVLIADDVSTNRMILEDMLQEAGHVVVSVSDGRELVDRLIPMINGLPHAEHFDIVLTDISMPILDGDAATREIRQLEKQNASNPRVPIIAITAHALREEQERIQRSGVDGVLVKPMYPEKVALEFARLLSTT